MKETAIYDERVKQILKGLMEGRSREDIAKDYDYANYRSLDMYMRRRNFQWNGKTYEPKTSRVDKIKKEIASPLPIKAERIIEKMENKKDPRSIAKEEGFEDHRELASYMEKHDLYWNGEIENYEYKPTVNIVERKVEEIDASKQKERYEKDEKKVGKYDELLDILYENKEKLLDILMIGSKNIPKYAVPGVATTKSIYMSELLARLITDFSEVKNISQRDIVQTAIVEYLSRYGYKEEVNQLLGKK